MTLLARPMGPACVARTPGPAAAVVTTAAAVMTMIVATTAAAWAQASTTVAAATSTVPPGDPDPLNAGGIVFLGVSAVVFGGALLLYLRHRRPRVRS